MGRKRGTETISMILLAFLENRVWQQAELARRVGIERKQLVHALEDLQQAGLRIDRDEEHPYVYWSVPKSWFPGAVAFRSHDVRELVRIIQLAPRSAGRARLLGKIAAVASGVSETASGRVVTRALSDAEEGVLAVLQEATVQRIAVRIKYYTLSRGAMASRILSIHRIFVDHGRFIASCHRDNRLKWFRIDCAIAAEPSHTERFREVSDEQVQAFHDESVDGFHSGTPALHCVFRVRLTDARWVRGLLPMPFEVYDSGDEAVFATTTAGLMPLARFLVGLGDAVIVETQELRDLVKSLAKGALHGVETAEHSSGVPIRPVK
ncbi:MAG TPA: WYL domain-containing protein [Polyangiaceae bacterium]